MVAAPPIFRGDLKNFFLGGGGGGRGQKRERGGGGGVPEQKIKFGAEQNLRGDLKF